MVYSEIQLEIRMENISIRADCIGHRGVSHRRMIQMQPLYVDSKSALFDGIEVCTHAKLACVSMHSVNSGTTGINLQKVFDRHARSLDLKSVIVDIRNAAHVQALI